MTWYYAVGDQQVGPVSKADLQALIRTKRVNARTRVWRPGMKEWQELGRLIKGDDTPHAPITPDSGRSRQVRCSECGNSFSQNDMIRFGESWICATCKPLFIQKIKEGLTVAGTMEYAGFWIRLGAKFIDWIIMGAVSFVILIPLGLVIGTSSRSSLTYIVPVAIQLLNWAIPAAYSTWFVGKYGATPGKMACRLKIVTADNDRVGYARALGRHFAEMLSGLILLIGYIMAAFDDQKRTLHDRICDTRVIRP